LHKKKAATASGDRYKEAREGGNLRAAIQENGIAKRGISTMMVQVEGIVCVLCYGLFWLLLKEHLQLQIEKALQGRLCVTVSV
jgi:hypothetical protein